MIYSTGESINKQSHTFLFIFTQRINGRSNNSALPRNSHVIDLNNFMLVLFVHSVSPVFSAGDLTNALEEVTVLNTFEHISSESSPHDAITIEWGLVDKFTWNRVPHSSD